MGALLLAVVLSAVVYGINCLQVYIYYTEASVNDSTWLKAFVSRMTHDAGRGVLNPSTIRLRFCCKLARCVEDVRLGLCLHSACDGAHLGLCIHAVYAYLVTGFGDYQALVRFWACRQFSQSDLPHRPLSPRKHARLCQYLYELKANSCSDYRSLLAAIAVGVSSALPATFQPGTLTHFTRTFWV
jgi:hypothetical protein